MVSLQVWLPLNGNLDNQGLSNISITNNGATVNASGKIGSCYQFGTAASDITIPKEAMTSFTTEASVCFWIKILTWNTSYATFFQAGPASAPWTSYIFGLLRNSANSTCCFTISNGSSASNASYLTPSLDLNIWYHISLIYKTGHCLIYINGQLHQDYETSIVPNFSSITTIKLGRCTNGSSYQTNCQMNDFRLYDHALSPKEVELISRGLVLHYPLNRNGFGQDNLLPGTWSEERTYTYPSSSYSDKFATSTTIVPSASQYTLSFYAKSTVNGDKIRTHYYSPNTTTTCVSSQGIAKTASDGNMDFTLSTNWDFYWVTYTQTETTAVKRVICPRMGSVKDQPGMSGTGIVSIRCIKFEEGNTATQWCPSVNDILYSSLGLNSNIIYDASGYGNNGILNDTTAIYSSDSARYNVSLKNNQEYNSSTYLIKGNCNIPESTNITFAWWMKPTRWGLQQSGLWSTSASGDATDYYTTAANMRDSYFDCCNTSGTCKRVEAASMVTLNEWHHYALTYDGANLKVYKDGVLKTSTAQTGALKAFTSVFLFYSKAGGANRNTSGYISDFRIYVTTLTEAQLLELYNTSASLANDGTLLSYEFVEGGA